MIVKHSGDAGDQIYGLWTVRKLGGCDLYLISNKFDSFTSIALLKPLLLSQSYIKRVEFIDEFKEYNKFDIDIDLDIFRGDTGFSAHPMHLAQAHVDMVNKIYHKHLPDFDGSKWLFNIPDNSGFTPYVCVQRSFRYRNQYFDYSKYIKNNFVMFVGTPKEYDDFIKLYPHLSIHWQHIDDFLEFASIIKSSLYFVGNQSIGSALAQAMRHPQIQEQDLLLPNCPPAVTLKEQPKITLTVKDPIERTMDGTYTQ